MTQRERVREGGSKGRREGGKEREPTGQQRQRLRMKASKRETSSERQQHRKKEERNHGEGLILAAQNLPMNLLHSPEHFTEFI